MFLARDPASNPPPENRGPAIIEALWVLMFIASIVMVARFYVRSQIVKRISADDWVMLFSFVATIATSICFTVAVHWGLGQHQSLLSPEASSEAFKWSFIGQITGNLSGTVARISFCMMLFAITSSAIQTAQSRVSRVLLWFIAVSQLLVNVGISVFIITQCQPITKMWDHGAGERCMAPENRTHIGIVQGAFNAATDLALAIFPATIIWNLNMKIAVKLSLIVTMGLGVFTMIASIVKTIHVQTLAQVSDYSYETSSSVIWFSLEIWFLIIAACIPTLRPLLSKSYRSKFGSKNGSGLTISGPKPIQEWNRRMGMHFTNLDADFDFKDISTSNISSPRSIYEHPWRHSNGEVIEKIAVGMEEPNLAGIRKTIYLEVKY